ncbi:hypothetical protein PENSUB_11069 [Penicillium subrubescens]|uniref:Uncharacterized protein n=1 Tax=Penicillium subrubescens TaxID=1316194 RepID=A0A1Q5T5P3_9EURO|nr:hypothetical protein PENSUB_11069 [Penicillium subrubescens]
MHKIEIHPRRGGMDRRLKKLKFSTLFKTPLSKIPGQRQRAPQAHCAVCSPGPEPLRFSPRQVGQVWVIVAPGLE